jgi:hypothetical protein
VWKRILSRKEANLPVPADVIHELGLALQDIIGPYTRIFLPDIEEYSAPEICSKALVGFVSSLVYVTPSRSHCDAETMASEVSSVLDFLEEDGWEDAVHFADLAKEIVDLVRHSQLTSATALLHGFSIDVNGIRSDVDELIVKKLLDNPGFAPGMCKEWLREHFPWIRDPESEPEPEFGNLSESVGDEPAEPAPVARRLPCGLVAGRYAPIVYSDDTSSDALAPPPQTPPPVTNDGNAVPAPVVSLVSDDDAEAQSISAEVVVDLTVPNDDDAPIAVVRTDLVCETLFPGPMSDDEVRSLQMELPASDSGVACPFPDENDRPSKRPRTRMPSTYTPMAIESLLN